ncbi:unnamed protein product [Rotaria magnacalcarata]|uniref:Uncharacterized protein n=4 Tax=Rotaria magnacalcarata TaxID=392030 RepID=A0A816T7F4_9BILA|nr:unnamed protein product [Rotaria magnacalcarata]CAF2114182.1 unnamed protein product [Rotaria magnacalcarata]
MTQYDGLLMYNDFRLTSCFTFQALRSICQLVDDAIRNSLTNFYATQYVSGYMVPSTLLESQAQALVNELRASTINEFSGSLDIVRQTTQANALFSSLQSNARLFIQPTSVILGSLLARYGNCACTLSSKCISPSAFYDGLNSTVLSLVRGMRTGCYILEALLQSSLECFYDPICFESMMSYLNSTVIWNGTVMNRTTPSRFLTTSAIGDILDELMIEIWNWTLKFDDYFAQCRPIACSYTVEARNDAIYIMTTLIGLVGGLVTALKLAVPNSVNLIRKKKDRQLCDTGMIDQ